MSAKKVLQSTSSRTQAPKSNTWIYLLVAIIIISPKMDALRYLPIIDLYEVNRTLRHKKHL